MGVSLARRAFSATALRHHFVHCNMSVLRCTTKTAVMAILPKDLTRAGVRAGPFFVVRVGSHVLITRYALASCCS